MGAGTRTLAPGSPAPPWDAQAAWRASEHAFTALGTLCFQAFLVAQFFSLTRMFFIQHLGGGAAFAATQAGLLSVVLLAPAVAAYGMRQGSLFGNLAAPARLWAAAVLVLALALFFYGWLGKEYVVTSAAHDLAPYLVIVSCAVLGSMPRVWRDTDRLLLILFALALAVNAVGMTEITHVVTEADAEDRAGVATVAYRTQGALAFWPLLFLTARLRRGATAFLIFAGVFFVLAQQILFQKRAPTLRIALYVLLFLLVLPALWPQRDPAAERRTRRLFLATGLLALAVAAGAAPWLFQGQLAGLIQRLSGEAYSGGATAMLTWENERFFEAGMFLNTLEPEELVFGRGFGGYFVPPAPGWGVWLDDVQEFGRRQLHVGGLMPFFKGGLVLTLAYYAVLPLALARGWRGRRHPLTAAAFFVVMLHAVFLFQEGWFIMSVSFDLVMVGLCLGRLCSIPDAGARTVRPAGAFAA